jgi:predicted nucleic acid-binding protein
MRVIVSDTSCIIDLRKGKLLTAVFHLPYSIVIGQPLFDDELLSISKTEKRELRALGLEVRELNGAAVAQAAKYFNSHPRLTLNDCFALALAEDIESCILLTGDRDLRNIAEGKGIEARGTLWVMDELEDNRIVDLKTLYDALCLFEQDPLVFLPAHEVRRRHRRIKRMLR